MQDQLGGTGTGSEPAMSDTAASTLPVPGGVAATFGLLMLIVAHATARRGKRSDSRA
jgi:type IV secretory pathway TrbD component